MGEEVDARQGQPGEPGEPGTAEGVGGHGGAGGLGGTANGHRRRRDFLFVGVMMLLAALIVVGFIRIRDNERIARDTEARRVYLQLIHENEREHQELICILLIEPKDRTPETVQACIQN